MAETSDDYEWPQSLKANLELLAQLQQNEGIRKKVTEEVLKKVKDYIIKNVEHFSGSSGFLSKTISKSKELRKNILNSGQETDYKVYSDFKDTAANRYAERLINNIFPLFSCLYYMYYECATECKYIEGGEWSDNKCDGSEHGEQKKHLNKWLQDLQGQNVKSSDSSSILMIKRGFKEGELSSNEGSKLFPGGSSTTALLYFKEGAQLQYCLYYMLFLPDDENWNNAQSGHALLFLRDFCEKVKDGEFFKDMYVDRDGGSFKTACQKVEQSIQKLMSSNTIVPVSYEQKGAKYADLLERKHFWKYIGWLIKNLSRLLVSLIEMSKDVSRWKEEALKTSTTFGPFPWGFVFKDQNWTSGVGLQQKLKDPLQNLNTELGRLKDAIDKIEHVSSTASTLGSVIGGLGATGAAAGAAYAGSGFLGSVAEGIGKFFKGLLW